MSLCTALALHGVLDPATLVKDQLRVSSSEGAHASGMEVIRGLGPRKAALLIGSFDPPETFSVVGTKHSGINQTSLGEVRRHSVHSKLFWGYSEEIVGSGQARVALPHKALLDLWYLSPRGWTPYVYERLQLKAELIDVTALESALTMFGTTRRIETAFRNFERYADRGYC